MKTDDLIRTLSADAGTLEAFPDRRTLGVAAVCFGVLLLAVMGSLGLRPDLSAVIGTPRVIFKFAVALGMVAAGGTAALRLMRPDCRLRDVAIPLALAGLVVVVGVASELAMTPPASWADRLVGRNAAFCLMIVPVLSVLPVTGLLLAARDGASSHAALSGAGIGLMAGGIAALAYAFHCPDDSPLFVATWYLLAAAMAIAVGSLAGLRLLRW